MQRVFLDNVFLVSSFRSQRHDGIEGDHFQIFVGRDARTMNLLNRLAPRRSTHLIYKQMKDLLSG